LASGLSYVPWYAALEEISATCAAMLQLGVSAIAIADGVLLLSEALTLCRVVPRRWSWAVSPWPYAHDRTRPADGRCAGRVAEKISVLPRLTTNRPLALCLYFCRDRVGLTRPGRGAASHWRFSASFFLPDGVREDGRWSW
jgi:hypothetical protein